MKDGRQDAWAMGIASRGEPPMRDSPRNHVAGEQKQGKDDQHAQEQKSTSRPNGNFTVTCRATPIHVVKDGFANLTTDRLFHDFTLVEIGIVPAEDG